MPIIHLGATSCYVCDNTDIILMREALLLTRRMLVNVLAALSDFAETHKALPTLAYTHFQAAQPTTMGKRATLWAQDILMDIEQLDFQLEHLKLLGCKGTTGTGASFLTLFDGDAGKVITLEKKICDGCGKCAKICPLGAISETETEEIDICGKKMVVRKVDYDKCKACKNGAKPNRLAASARPDRMAALCTRTCLCHLEEEGILSNRFENSFRKRDAWALDAFGRSVNTGSDNT
jgi:ferredoxin